MQYIQITIPPGREQEALGFYGNMLELRKINKPKSLISKGGFWLQMGDSLFQV